MYLHPTRAASSDSVGSSTAFEEVTIADLGRKRRIVLVVDSSREGNGRMWRGPMHAMAHSGSLVEAVRRHEVS